MHTVCCEFLFDTRHPPFFFFLQEFPHLLKQYYERLFPYSRFYRWLSYQGDTKLFQNREFSFTLKDGTTFSHSPQMPLRTALLCVRTAMPLWSNAGAQCSKTSLETVLLPSFTVRCRLQLLCPFVQLVADTTINTVLPLTTILCRCVHPLP